MSNRYNNGSHYENHQRAAELHDLAAHAHRAAEQQHGKQDYPTGHEHSRRALEHSQKAHQHTEELAAQRRINSFGHAEVAALSYDRWAARGYPEGSADEDWFHALEELRSRTRAGS